MDYKKAFGNSQRMIYNEYQYLSLKKKWRHNLITLCQCQANLFKPFMNTGKPLLMFDS